MAFKHPSNILKALLHYVWSGTESAREASKQEVIEICKAPSQKETLNFKSDIVDTDNMRQSPSHSPPRKSVARGGIEAFHPLGRGSQGVP